MAPSMRLNAIRRPPASHTAALTLMFISWALVTAACTIRLASASVRAIVVLLFGGRAAVDDQLAARHVRRFIGGEVYHAVRDFLGRSHATHRQPPQALLPRRLVLERVLDHVGRDRPGMHRVGTDLVLGVLDRRRLGEDAHRTLRRAIGR